MYAQVVFFIPLDKIFTYRVPGSLQKEVLPGVRVVAPFGKKTLTGFCLGVSEDIQGIDSAKVKDICDVLDGSPIVSPRDLELYHWMADYYLCSLGDVLRHCTPYGADISSKRKITSDPAYCMQLYAETDARQKIRRKVLEVLLAAPALSFRALQKDVGKKNIYAAVRQLQEEGAITVQEVRERAKIQEKRERFVKLCVSEEKVFAHLPELERRSPVQLAMLMKLLEYKDTGLPLAALLNQTKGNAASVSALAKKGFVDVLFRKVRRRAAEQFHNDLESYQLTTLQKKAFDEVEQAIGGAAFKVFLLHGVTGSGKTLIYLDLAEKVLAQGRSVLLLVPEISLTPQITARFFARFGEQAVVIHSMIAPGERLDTWNAIRQGEATIVIGARSAMFAPMQNPGLIIVDEEHDASYKQQDNAPKYHARDTAIMKGKLWNCPVLLGSATPSIESMHNARAGKYTLLELPERADDAKLPDITLVNVIEEKKKKRMQNIFSQTMIEKINEKLRKKEGIILLQNRRGFSTQVYCFDCGEIETCDHCSVSLVHHLDTNLMKCHYCGMEREAPSQCSKCGSYSVKFFGTGTERVEDELAFYFPDTKMERVDSDSIQKKGSLSATLNRFRLGETDILIGTQIVAKGLDFARVTLVCVVSAETNLWLPDFRADERSFQLLTQVAGRAGRSIVKGEVMIQTQNDKHPTLRRVVTHDYQGFYTREEANRKRLNYPPFTRICLIELKHKEEHRVKGAVIDLHAALKMYQQYAQIAPPCTAVIAKLRGEYRFQILLRTKREDDPSGSVLRKVVRGAYHAFREKSPHKDVPVYFDIDPQSVI